MTESTVVSCSFFLCAWTSLANPQLTAWNCDRRYTLPLEDFYINTPGGPDITLWTNGQAGFRKGYNCSSQCSGALFCGAGEMGSGVSGTYMIGSY